MTSKRIGRFPVVMLFVGSAAVGAVGMLLFLNMAQPTGWMLSARGSDTASLSLSELRLLRDLLRDGNVLAPTDILANFVGYYHTLVTILIAIILFLAGFVTYSYFRSRQEYTDIMERELHGFFRAYERNLSEQEGQQEELEKYEALQSWLSKRVLEIISESDGVVQGTVIEMLVTELLGDKDFVSQVKLGVLDSIRPDEGE